MDKPSVPFFVTTFHPGLNAIASALHERFPILQTSESCKKIFPRPLIKAWRRGTNMKEILCPSRLPPIRTHQKPRGFSKCNEKDCNLCPFALDTGCFSINGYKRKVTQTLNCKSSAGVHAILCEKCLLFYIGRTADTAEARFKQHKRDIDNGAHKNLARHFR
jgi:hypothetical protein